MSATTSNPIGFVQKASVLAGKFKGTGTVFHKGTTIPYLEECAFVVMRKNPKMVVYRLQQDTKHGAQENKPMHMEMGVLKIFNNNEDTGGDCCYKTEAGWTHPFPSGTVNEMAKGTLKGKTLTLESMGFQRANEEGGDKHVTGLRRVYQRDGTKLTYDQFLAVDGNEPTHHLHCELELQQE